MLNILPINIVVLDIYIYIYIHTHTHTHTVHLLGRCEFYDTKLNTLRFGDRLGPRLRALC
jgi:hypothetical protein